MCSPAQPVPFMGFEAHRQAFAWSWLMSPRKKAAQAEPAPRQTRRARRATTLEWGIPAVSWRTIAGIAALVGLLLLGIKAVTYANSLATSITTLAGAVGKLDGTMSSTTNDVVAIKQRLATYDVMLANMQAQQTDMAQREQRMEQTIADIRTDVAGTKAGRQ
jgi:hypothetical protein